MERVNITGIGIEVTQLSSVIDTEYKLLKGEKNGVSIVSEPDYDFELELW